MYLDKKKLKDLIEKTEKLTVTPTNNFSSQTQPSIASQLNTILSGLSGWLDKQSTLTSGAAYGKKLAQLKAKLPDPKHYNWPSPKDNEALRKEILALLRTIDKENKSIFIVHGRNTQMRDDVQNVLRALGIANVILDREDDLGQTVIEKFEKEAARCEYAIVICSADDKGRLRTKSRTKELPPLKPRARQNVILELGYFLALLGRRNVFVLHPEEVIEQPSDFAGVVYQTYDKADKWKAKLVRELKAVGFKILATQTDRM